MDADGQYESLLAWVHDAHHQLDSLEPTAPTADLAALEGIIADARVIGVGEAVRGARSARELRRFVHRVLRFAVEHLGVRTLVLEENSLVAATALDDYIRAGTGTALAALRGAWTPWQSMETLEVIEWLRSRNVSRADDPVRIVGAISEDSLRIAGHVLDCLDRFDGRVVYWGGAAHSAVAPADDDTSPPRSPAGRSDGDRLREALGSGYLSVGCLCDHAVTGERLPPPPNHFVEAPLAGVAAPAWYLDLRGPSNEVAHRWAGTPATTRLIGPRYDPAENASFCMSGSPLAHWFDAILYVREITPCRPLPVHRDPG